jgi:glucose/arabinose dehydrogenase
MPILELDKIIITKPDTGIRCINFGWPLYSIGINYNGTTISNGHIAAGITAPLKSWTPAFAPAGLTFINHASFRDWNGNILMGSLGAGNYL